MTTQTISKFKHLDTSVLSNIEGGVSPGELGQAFAVCTVAGAILGAQYCTAAWAIIRQN